MAAAALDLAAQAGVAKAQVRGAGLAGKDYAGALAKLRAYADLHVSSYGLAGLTVTVVDRDGFMAEFQVGLSDIARKVPVSPDHLFQIGSISKSFTAIAILQAAEAGKLDLDSTVKSHLPHVPLPAEPITVRQVLSHVSGLPDDPPPFPRGIDGLWLGFKPTTNWSYSNLGFRLLGMVLEQVHGRPYTETIQTIFDKLGMKDARPLIATSDFDRYAVGHQPVQADRPCAWPGPLKAAPWVDFCMASGSVAAPARDMARYMRFLIEAGNGKGAPLLSDAAAKAFVTPVSPALEFGPGAQYALGVAVVQNGGRSLIHHTGGMIAFSSSFHVDAPAGVACFASTNTNIEGYRPRDVTAYACHLFRTLREGTPPPAPRAITLGDTVEKAADYVGDYHYKNGPAFSIRARDGGLELVDGSGVGRLQMKGEDLFMVRKAEWSVHPLVFVRQNGQVVGVWHGDLLIGRGDHNIAQAIPPEYAGKAGRYDNDDPWLGSMRVVARPDGLYADDGTPLVPLGDGVYRLGPDPAGCERVQFDGEINGQTHRLNFSGVDFWRKYDPIAGHNV
ncbi:MAG TPA: serine hydrolase domain-containing protein [Caulobacteraceae bacterium]|nr:serine hydrolase domain-containing protein [Caulobacteraceae bacterium]